MTQFLKNCPNALSYNKVFERVFSDEVIVKEFIELLMGRKIKTISNLQCEKQISPEIDSKTIRFDIYFEGDDALYDTEMQRTSEPNLTRRIRAYQSLLDRDALPNTTRYRYLKQTVIIFICDFDPIHRNLPIYEKVMGFKGLPDVEYDDGTSVYILNGKYDGNDFELPLGLVEFFQRVCGKPYTETSNFAKLLDNKLSNVLSDSSLQELVIRDAMDAMLIQSQLEDAQAKVEQANARLEQANAKIEQTEYKMQIAKAEEAKAKAEADKAKAEANSYKFEADKAKAEIDKAKAEIDKAKSETEKAICLLLKTMSVEDVAKVFEVDTNYILCLVDKYNLRPEHNSQAKGTSIKELNFDL